MCMIVLMVAFAKSMRREGVETSLAANDLPALNLEHQETGTTSKVGRGLQPRQRRRQFSLGSPPAAATVLSALPSSALLLCPMQIPAFARWALLGPTRSKRDFPSVLAVGTLECTHFDGTSFDTESLALDEGLCNFFSSRFHDPAKRLPGDFHPVCRLLLVQPLEIGQSQRLELV